MVFPNKSSILVMTITLFVLLTGCTRGEAVDEVAQYISPIEQIDIPHHVKVIGLGRPPMGTWNFKN